MKSILRPYRFVSNQESGFKVVVMAVTRRSAARHVKSRGVLSRAWKQLEYVGDGHPPESERPSWLVSVHRPVQ